MTDIPVGMTQLMHLNALSADLALSLSSSRSLASLPSAPWSHQTFQHYADARRRTAPPPEPSLDDLPSSRPPPLALPQRDATERRRARQQAALRARRHRVMSEAHSSSTVTSHAASASSSSDDDPPPDLHALLRKKGRKTRLPVRRMFVLRAGTLYNFRNPKADAPSWKVALAGAVVGLDPRTLRIVVLLNPHRTLVLYADSPQQASQWTEALARAAAFERGPDTSTTSRGSSGSSTAWDADTANNNNIAEIRTMTSFVDDEDSDWRKGARHPDFGLPPQDLALDVPENDNWDSFRSFAKLHIRTATGPDAIRERVAMGLAQPRYGDAVAYA